jgi:hypothetical protein
MLMNNVCPLCNHLSTVPHIKVYGYCATCKQNKMRNALSDEREIDISDAEIARQKAIEEAEIKCLMEIKAQEDKLLLTKLEEERERLRLFEEKQNQERERQYEEMLKSQREHQREQDQKNQRLLEEHKIQAQRELVSSTAHHERLREQDLVNLITSINSSIADADKKPMSSIPNFTYQMITYGYRLLSENSSSKIGDCYNGLNGVPLSVVNKHRNLTSNGNSHDNRYVIYEEGNKKYIVGCHRCLELWQHKCKIVVYVK